MAGSQCFSAREMIASNEISNYLPAPRVVRHDRFWVVRDDLIHGGTKTRALLHTLQRLAVRRVAYACDWHGYGPIALAHASQLLGLQATLIFPVMTETTSAFNAVRDLKHVEVVISANARNQNEAYQEALPLASSRGAHLFPIGFDTPEFVAALVEVAKSVDIDPAQVWSLAGSGCLTRALQATWPDAEMHVVSMGFPHMRVGRAEVHAPDEVVTERARVMPPYPAAPYYDAKVWRVAQSSAADDALIWNVA